MRLTGHGDISDAELIGAVQLMYSNDQDTKRHKCALIDFSRSERLDISSEVVREAADLSVTASKLVAPGAAVAIVVSKPLAFGLGRMWEAYAEGTGWTTRVFQNLEEAENWLERRFAALGLDSAD